MDESQSDFLHDGRVPCGTREEDTWHMNGPKCHALKPCMKIVDEDEA